MQTLSVGETRVLIDDDTAAAVVWFAVQLAKTGRTDCVEVSAYDLDEQPVDAQLVLGPGIGVTAVTAHHDIPDPDNAAVCARIRADTDGIENPPSVQPEDPAAAPHADLLI